MANLNWVLSTYICQYNILKAIGAWERGYALTSLSTMGYFFVIFGDWTEKRKIKYSLIIIRFNYRKI